MEFAAAALVSVANGLSSAGTAVSGALGFGGVGGSTALTNAAAFGAAELIGGGTVAGFNTASALSGGALASGLGKALTVGSILSGGLTVAAALGEAAAMQGQANSALAAAEEKASSLEAQAADDELSVQIEKTDGLERRASLRAALVKAVGDRAVSAAAAGVDLSFGTPAIAQRQAADDTARALAVDSSTEDQRRSRLMERAATYRRRAIETRGAGLATAAGIQLGGAAKILRRG